MTDDNNIALIDYDMELALANPPDNIIIEELSPIL